jgi:hypothetical protein
MTCQWCQKPLVLGEGCAPLVGIPGLRAVLPPTVDPSGQAYRRLRRSSGPCTTIWHSLTTDREGDGRKRAMASIDIGRNQWRTAALIAAPAVLLAALVAHPYLSGRLPNDAEVAEAVAGGITRWGLVHLATSVAFGLIILAFLAVRSYLREEGEERFSALGVPFIVIGSTLSAVLPGMEFAPLAAAETGATTAGIEATQEALSSWFTPVLVSGALAFAIGVFGFAQALSVTTLGGRALSRVVVVALIVMAISRFVPLAAVQFYVQGVAAIVALWPLAYAMRTQPAPEISARAGPSG